MTQGPGKKFDLDLETLYGPDGRLAQRLGPVHLTIPPTIDLRDDWLVWSWPLSEPVGVRGPLSMRSATEMLTVHRRVPARFECLGEFVELEDATRERILCFARKWGVLGICRHGLPATHNPWLLPFYLPPAYVRKVAPGKGGEKSAGKGRSQGDYGDPLTGCAPILTSADGSAGREPLAAWRFYARNARVILRVARRVRRGGRRWERADWEVLSAGRPFQPDREFPRTAWEYVALAVNGWLRAGNVRPSLVPSDKPNRPRITISPEWAFSMRQFPLFGELGLQLMFAVSTERGLEWCSSCGRPFEPRRRPAGGRRSFCGFCRRKGAARLASADYRARKRLAGRTQSRGTGGVRLEKPRA